ncbi:MAG: prepilin-type N-terminal cleavage/methylation domain-containing protein [Chromatiaceae bacterium]|jgi:general secretion pathway protein I
MKGPGSGRRLGQLGFSLIEVLVAFSILAVSLGVLMQIFSRASLTTAASVQYSRAAGLASSRLEAVGTAIPVEPGAVTGDPEGGMAWEVNIVPLEGDARAQAELGIPLGGGLGFVLPAMPYRVLVNVLWRDGDRARRLTLSTLRLGAPLE